MDGSAWERRHSPIRASKIGETEMRETTLLYPEELTVMQDHLHVIAFWQMQDTSLASAASRYTLIRYNCTH
jgi:hypothetical protein